MNKKKKYKISSLSYVLQIGQQTEGGDDGYYWKQYFDKQGNYISDWCGNFFMLWPWEWVMHPEIVKLAEQLGVEVPENPEIDLSKTF